MLALDRVAVDRRVSVRMVFLSHFFNTALVGASAGDVVKIALYSRWYNKPMPGVAAACVLDRLAATLGGLGFLVMALVLAVACGAFNELRDLEWELSRGSLGLMGGAVLGLIVVILFVRRYRSETFLGKALHSFRGSTRELINSPMQSGLALVLALSTACLLILAQISCLRAVLGEPVQWLHLLWVTHLITMIASLPVTIAGTGLREGASLVLLKPYGVEEAQAVVAALLTLSLHVVWALVGAGLFVSGKRT
jgi:hypothetical protein